MRWSCLTLCVLLAVAACTNHGRADDTATSADTAAVAAAPTSEPGPLQLAELAGRWKMTATNAANDSTLVVYEMTATADTTGWSIMYPTHPKAIALHVKVDADSVIMDAGPYASTARKGATVTIHGVSRLEGGKLVGAETARYRVDSTESVVHITLDGIRG